MALNKYEKALLDVIAFAEGTLGESQNGYDITVNFYRIIGWTPDTNIIHGGWSFKVGDKFSTAAGRYQFLIGTWERMNGGKNAPLSKDNQDNACIKLVKKYLKYNDFEKRAVTISELENENKFYIMMNKLSRGWASFILTSDITYNEKLYKKGFGYYGGQGSKKPKEEFYRVYKLALKKYTDLENNN